LNLKWPLKSCYHFALEKSFGQVTTFIL
jgi:hypothetical protein